MPGNNGTGPLGRGPMTGRGLGYCVLKLSETDPLPSTIRWNQLGRSEQETNIYTNFGKEVTTMPGGNKTGPAGLGPMTGRGAGYCSGNAAPGYASNFGQRGGFGAFGRGFGGGGRGRRNWFYATGLTGWQRANMNMPQYGPTAYSTPFTPAITKEQELNEMKNQAEYFEDALADIRKRIDELQAKSNETAT